MQSLKCTNRIGYFFQLGPVNYFTLPNNFLNAEPVPLSPKRDSFGQLCILSNLRKNYGNLFPATSE